MKSEIVDIKDLKNDPVFGQLSFDNHEQIVFCNDEDTGLKAIIGIHNTTLGPALGGTRMWQYKSESEALNDVLRLSRGMTYKAAITGLNLGGGKAVIIGDAKTQKNDALMRKFGAYVNSLSGKYITAEDVGMETHDMDVIREVTPHVAGISEEIGGSGNPSPVTAYGVYMGMKAAAKYRFGSDNLAGKKVLVQGVGHVGETLVKHITDEGAQVILNDINEARLEELSKKYGANVVLGNDIYGLDVDIYAPCALGATLNDQSIAQLKAKIVAGAANNQLENELRHGKLLREKGIAYAPDFLINAGGIINVYAEVAGYDKAESLKRTENIYNTTLDIFNLADKENSTTHQAAFNIAQARIDARKKEQNN
ncbi:Glu/Leu/Phe/Val dehydrogenase [Tenacibaculum finnmarkense]|uniref:Glu/Leu/Phe/Val family dehydrogenase n=1 Tax=Tenacibaculum finnmarkense TaxID=2781243 RepID=UPI0007393E84|nr:Glu/Leu/Phe/Val dehydrogenase [Tenacibaculum finnmarkense]ALU74538.1 leucine dehydrogenase [Tenacibaculum dicentrarchi]MBE7634434.1 leucine dehydrogenase [Tenacibaculum finnmarkense genomovar ulcerans]MBE7645595.1 leucine dehydrogenase [Tenacibaculum finnmarkense genomovar ulcerans]MBE7647578.1 leucine dehydrogenase [Tenacibaculum finnmarkense genomovar ulcerans]MBE7660460.1 leucine dehydrogenase [Tenacibaculum finnmarkense genomovar finnmarkense]